MPTILTNGIQLPDKGSVDWYSSMQSNYNLIDTHLGNTDTHVTAEDKANWNSKQGSLSQAQLDAIAQVATNTSDIATLQSGKANASHTHSSSDITDIDDYATKQYVDSSISGLVDNAPAALDTLKELSTALNDDANFATTVTNALASKANSADLATVATSGSYNDLSNKPIINDSTITIQKNSSTVDTFTTNGSSKTIDILVPTKTSDLTNDSNFVDTSNSAVASGITSAKVTDYDSHIADTDIHVTAADKTKWNNGVSQAYVLRYSSTAITDNSTIAYSTLDNTDNIKVSDKIIDTDGKIFSVVSVDSANQTVTVGSALIDLALDADVMHLSGDETAAGIKTFSDDTYIKSLNFTNQVPSQSSTSSSIMPMIVTITYGDGSPSVQARLNFRVAANGDKSFYPHENNQYSLGLTSRRWSSFFGYFVNLGGTYLGNEASTNQRTNLYLLANRDADGQSGCYVTRYRQNKAQGALAFSDQQQIGIDFLENSVRTTNLFNIVATDWTNNVPGRVLINSGIANNSFGSVTRKCLINELNPGALSFPDLDNALDISGFVDVTQTSQYTAPADGYISICGYASSTNAILIKDHDYDFAMTFRALTTSLGATTYFVMPVIKNHVYDISCSAVTNIAYAKFFPCQGNV